VNYRIFPIGENALTVDFGSEISAELNDRVLSLAEFIGKNSFTGFVELVPAYSSLTVFYDLVQVRKTYRQFPNVFSAVKNFVETALENLPKISKREPDLIKIPVCYEMEFAPDLEFVARCAKLTTAEVIKIHTSTIYRVFMIGFLPAFAYMGEVDTRITAPRRANPRTKIEPGSVGIAGRQTGIYPLASPGGWQIIGKTPLQMFRPERKKISFLKMGDMVNFFEIGSDEFKNKSKIENRKSDEFTFPDKFTADNRAGFGTR